MREWQVGDPVGDGNDIGVPDTRYMGYSRDDEESCEYDIVNEFKGDINHSRYCYSIKKYDDAFCPLKSAFKEYGKMNDFEKSQIRDDPFNQYWIIDLCCKIYNKHVDESWDAYDIIMQHHLSANVCTDCACAYPTDYTYCIKCGKELEKHRVKSPEEIAEEIPDALRGRVYEEDIIQRLVDRSIKLMKSNDCRLIGIKDGLDWNLDFIFEKEHKYFKTTYACAYNPNYYGPLIFEDFAVTHNYDDLLADESFKKLIRDTENRTGFTFKECAGGFGYQLDDDRFDFIFNDEINVTVCFDMGDGNVAIYDIDLDSMELSEEYRVY